LVKIQRNYLDIISEGKNWEKASKKWVETR